MTPMPDRARRILCYAVAIPVVAVVVAYAWATGRPPFLWHAFRGPR